MDHDQRKHIKKINRRDFIKMGATGAGVAALGSGASCSKSEAVVPRKKLGKTAMKASILAMGGGSALTMVKKDEDALRLIDFARRKGVNYFDTGSGYGDGKSEQRFGQALSPYRKEVYLSTKYSPSDGREKLMKKFETSLSRFRTDYIDVANMHGLATLGHVEQMFTSGALETLIELKEQGAVRNIGLTSHNHPPAVVEALGRYDFDVALVAANASKVPFTGEFENISEGSFEDNAIPLGLKKGIGLWAFKVTGQRRLIAKAGEPDKAPALELIRYALSLPVHGIILGMSTPEHVETAAVLAADFTPMTAEEMRSWNKRLFGSANELTLNYLNPSYVDDGGPREHLGWA